MLTLTVKQLRDSLASFTALAQQRITNVRLAYNLSKTLKDLQSEAVALNEQETAIFRAAGGTQQRLANGQVAWVVETEKMEESARAAFQQQLDELAKMPLEVWGHPISLEEIEAAQLTLSASDFALLDWLIKEAEPANKAASAAA